MWLRKDLCFSKGYAEILQIFVSWDNIRHFNFLRIPILLFFFNASLPKLFYKNIQYQTADDDKSVKQTSKDIDKPFFYNLFLFFFFSGFIKSTTFYGTHGMHLFHNLKWMYVEVDDCNSSKKIVSFIKWAVAQNLAVLFLPSHACAVSLTRFYYVHSIILNWPDSFIWKFGMLFSIINLFSVRLSVTIYLLV